MQGKKISQKQAASVRDIYACPTQIKVKTTEFRNLGEEKYTLFALTTPQICEYSSVYRYLMFIMYFPMLSLTGHALTNESNDKRYSQFQDIS